MDRARLRLDETIAELVSVLPTTIIGNGHVRRRVGDRQQV